MFKTFAETRSTGSPRTKVCCAPRFGSPASVPCDLIHINSLQSRRVSACGAHDQVRPAAGNVMSRLARRFGRDQDIGTVRGKSLIGSDILVTPTIGNLRCIGHRLGGITDIPSNALPVVLGISKTQFAILRGNTAISPAYWQEAKHQNCANDWHPFQNTQASGKAGFFTALR